MSMRRSLILAICLPLMVQAVQVSPGVPAQAIQQESGAKVAQAASEGVSLASFFSDDGSICFEGPQSIVDTSLALRKVAPYRALFNTSFMKSGVRCADSGYANFVSEDDCYPGVALFQKSGSAGIQKYKAAGLMALSAYAKQYGLQNSNAEVMSFCTCHGDSKLRAHAKSHCTKLESMASSWVHPNPQGNGLACDQGRFESASRAVALLKSSAQLPMHLIDQVHPVNCSKLGFPELMKEKAVEFGHFLSNDNHACFEGLLDTAGNALALKKATPYGEVFNRSIVKPGNCASQGYSFTVGRDDCYAGMKVFTRSQYSMMMYKLHKHNRLTDYSKHYDIPYHKVELMLACSCHPKSHLRSQRAADCANLEPMQLSWVRTLPQSSEQICDEGPFESMTRGIVLLKNTLKLPNLSDEHFAPLPCSEHLKDQKEYKKPFIQGSII